MFRLALALISEPHRCFYQGLIVPSYSDPYLCFILFLNTLYTAYPSWMLPVSGFALKKKKKNPVENFRKQHCFSESTRGFPSIDDVQMLTESSFLAEIALISYGTE